jgi:hypothetical protein
MAMANGTGVFVLTEGGALVPMQTASFASEDDFQALLGRFPALLAGDQIDSVAPRRFLLIDREQPIASEPGGGNRWSIDHLFLDQDGVPTLVEVKRGTDTRIRREVVGQMMDYAANAILHWPIEALRERFKARCEAAGENPAEALADHLGGDQDFDDFWARVKANLQGGRVRLLFVADQIPPELRKIVEFLNGQMRPAEVLAVELRQYEGQGLKTLVPIVIGQTQDAIEQKSGPASGKPRRLWDEARLLQSLADREGADILQTAKAVATWIRSKGDRVVFNDAPNYGSMAPEIDCATGACAPIRLWTDGTIAIHFNALKRTNAFTDLAARHKLAVRLNALPGVAIKPEALERQPGIRLAALTNDQGAGFLEVMDWVVTMISGGVPA